MKDGSLLRCLPGMPVTFLCFCLSLVAGRAADRITSSNLHNAFMVTPKIFSGSAPEGDAGFIELARMGVKAIISVDGAKPDLDSARRRGLRYIHLPLGYGGISSNRVVQLVKASRMAEGPIYVHCHQGKHRGPAAAAIICEATAGWSRQAAEQWLHEAGTSSEYPGLYRSVREFLPPTASELAAVQTLKEVEPTSSFVEAMVAADEHFGRLKAAQKEGWREEVAGHPEKSPAAQATSLWEQFRELVRATGQGNRPDSLAARLAGAEESAGELRTLLRQPSKDYARADEAFRNVAQSCVDCHKHHRN